MPALCAWAIPGNARQKNAAMYFALDFILHLLVRRVEDATLLSQPNRVLADKKWNCRTCIKRYGGETACRTVLTAYAGPIRLAIALLDIIMDSDGLAARLGE